MGCCGSNSLSFLITGPIILAFLFLVNTMTGGEPWWYWAALGIGLAWVLTLLRAMRLLIMVGSLAGIAALLARRRM
ncbi:hypothetical protein D3C83_45420 [compost metagenome]